MEKDSPLESCTIEDIIKLISMYKENVSLDDDGEYLSMLINLLSSKEVKEFYQFLQEVFEMLKKDKKKAIISVIYVTDEDYDYPDVIISVIFDDDEMDDVMPYLSELYSIKNKFTTSLYFVGFGLEITN